jgi:hypothetical protein
MSEPTPVAISHKNTPSDTWTALLECAEAADSGLLDLDGSAPQIVALAEHLVDMGLLRVPHAGCYTLTPAGREMIASGKTGPSKEKPTRSWRPTIALLIAGFAAIALALWASL